MAVALGSVSVWNKSDWAQSRRGSGNTVDVNGKPVPVRRTSRQQLRTLAFTMDGREYQAIEQNAAELRLLGGTGTGGASGRAVQGREEQSVCGCGRGR